MQRLGQTNEELNKSLTQLTAQNTQSTRDLNTAREHALNLERQLQELKSKTGSSNIGTIIAAVVITALITAIICLTI